MEQIYTNIQTKEVLNMDKVRELAGNKMLKSNPELWNIWDFNKNGELDIYKITRGSGRKAWFYCKECDTSNQQFIKNKTKGIGCPTCRGFYPSKTNNLAVTHPELARQWHPSKNGELTPSDVSQGSEIVIWWIGECGHEYDMNIDSRTRGRNCPYCSGKRVSKHINSLSFTHPHLAQLLKDEEDGHKYSKGSEMKVEFICECGNEITKAIYSVVARGLCCPKCKDGLSFGEKVMYNILRENNIDFLYDCTTEFSHGKRYDFIIPHLNMIIEIDGEQHSKDRKSSFSKSGRTLKEEQENDKYKEQLAIDNGYLLYYNISSLNQDFEFLHKNIISSGLLSHLNIGEVDKNKINELSRKSIIFEVCEYYNNKSAVTTSDISEEFKISDGTVRKYLKIGSQLNLCNYVPKDNKFINSANAKLSRRVVQLTLEGDFIQEHSSFTKAYSNLGYKKFNNLAKCCDGEIDSCVGFKWMYEDDYKESIKSK